MTRWGMAIDLQRCVGCYACTVSCKQVHFLPPGIFWNRIITTESGKYPSVRKLTYPVLCNHCSEAACVEVCPTGASSRREDGMVLIDYDNCVGCGYCIMACPYKQRTRYEERKEYFPGQGYTPYEQMAELFFPLKKKTAVKCNFCVEQIDSGLEKGLIPGVDREATPTCVNACPTKARVFGDLDESESTVARLVRERKGEQLRPDFGTDPSIYYISY